MKHISYSDHLLHLSKQLEARVNFRGLAKGINLDVDYDSNSRFSNGGQRSFVPELGKVIWEMSTSGIDQTTISAKIYELDDKATVGYIRVPHYEMGYAEVEIFRSVINQFNTETDALILDQVNNPGGNLIQAYALLSHLTDRTLNVPMHQMSFDDDQIEEAKEAVWLADTEGDGSPDEWPTTEFVEYSRFVLSEVEAGRKRLSNPGFAFGIESILPSPDSYSKPILVLVNELTFSAPEYLAAIMQDNDRAKIFGANTAGAGGLSKVVSEQNHPLGIDYWTYTWAMALRANGKPFEGIGIQPDILYSLTVNDMQNEFSGYRNALINALREIW